MSQFVDELGKNSTRDVSNPANSQYSGSSSKKRDTPRLIKLISVRLKEAALDSPSFRASCNHLNSQIDLTEQWIEGLIKSTKRYPQQYNDFKDVNAVFLNQLIPDFLKSGLIDQENTSSVLDTTRTNLQSLWNKDFEDLDVNHTEIVELLSEISKNHLKKYREARKNFEFIQSKYDNALAKYGSLSKTKEPSSLREDAFQLFDIRKSYLSASLEICIEISRFHQVLDVSLVKLSELIFKGKDAYNDQYFAKVTAWSEAIQVSVESLLSDMNRSKEQIQKATIAQFEPTRDLKQHNLALLNPGTLTTYDSQIDNPNEEHLYEKHGWLFMKTTVGKPARQIWVRRWVFVKTGIFGLFLLSPSKNYVQETDKIGVLLSNIRYAPDEDRRFCFEVKTIESTIIFQAESLKDLRAWLRVFSQEKQRAIENSQSESGKYAFGRFPPLLYDFASTSFTSVDVELTSSKVENANKDDTFTTVESSHLSALVGNNDTLEMKLSAAPEFRDADLNTPLTTAKSRIALISHTFLSQTVVPTAVTANIWGSVNWGMYYMSETLNKKPNSQENQLTSLDTKDRYPAYYPSRLKHFDMQLKSLFDTVLDRDELVVLHFTCLWSVNPGQELSGSCFATTKNSYIYLNSTGFVSLLKRPLSDVVAVDVISDKGWDVIKYYDIDGLSMKGRVFLEDGKLIQKTIDLLINNISSENPKSQEELIPIIESLRSEEASTKMERKSSKGNQVHHHHNELNSFKPFDGVAIEDKSRRTNYRQEYEKCYIQSFNVPAKALFHMMYGDNSTIFKDTAPFVDTDDFRISPWYTTENGLSRYIDFKHNISNNWINLQGTQGNIPSRRVQTIEQAIDNKYYRINEASNYLKIFGCTLRMVTKTLIVEENAKSCKALIYGRVELLDSDIWPATNFYKKSVYHFYKLAAYKMFEILQQLTEGFGAHGKIIKSIRTYGNLSKSNEPLPKKEEIIPSINFRLVLKYYSKIILFTITNIILGLARWVFTDGFKLLENLSAHRVLLFFLTLSIIFNLFLSGRSTISFWRSWRLEKSLVDFRKGLELNKVERSISINEVDLLSSVDFNNTSSPFEKYLYSTGIRDPSCSGVDARFRETKHQLAVKRNELLVELKILEKVEKELVIGNYRNFLLSELNMCNIALEEMNVDDEALKDYCSLCSSELKKASSTYNLL